MNFSDQIEVHRASFLKPREVTGGISVTGQAQTKQEGGGCGC